MAKKRKAAAKRRVTRKPARKRGAGSADTAVHTLVVRVGMVVVLGGLYFTRRTRGRLRCGRSHADIWSAHGASTDAIARDRSTGVDTVAAALNQRRHHCRRRLSPRQLRLHRLTQPEACSRPRRPPAPRRVTQRADLFHRLRLLKRGRPQPLLWCPRRTTSPRLVMWERRAPSVRRPVHASGVRLSLRCRVGARGIRRYCRSIARCADARPPFRPRIRATVGPFSGVGTA